MAPWPTEPASYATGILDDITYDWLPIVDGMLATGGFPLVATDDDFRAAHRLGHTHTAIPVCPTGAAGLGGLLALDAEGVAHRRPPILRLVEHGVHNDLLGRARRVEVDVLAVDGLEADDVVELGELDARGLLPPRPLMVFYWSCQFGKPKAIPGPLFDNV